MDTTILHEEKYRVCTKIALLLLAATFGIVVTGSMFANPFSALTTEAAKHMWGEDMDRDEERDTWEQMVWFITNNSISSRTSKLDTNTIEYPTDIEAQKLLHRVEKLSQIDDNPILHHDSLASTYMRYMGHE